MPLNVKYENKAFPSGEPLEFYGVLLENGKARELSEEEEIRLVQRLGQKPSDAFKNSDAVKVTGSMSTKMQFPSDVSTVASAADHPNAPDNDTGGES